MKTNAIIYSSANLDSCLASAIMTMCLTLKGDVVHNFDYNRETDLFDTDCSNPGIISSSPTLEYECIYILGADLSADCLVDLIGKYSDSTVYHLYNYSNSTVYPARFTEHMNESHRFKVHTDDGGDGFRISVSSRVCSHLPDEDTLDEQDKEHRYSSITDIKDYAGIVSLYGAFRPMTMPQTVLLHANISSVKNAARGQLPLNINSSTSDNANSQYSEYVKDVRKAVKANMQMAYYAGANGAGLYTPTVCVGERDAIVSMRFISYAHEEVISYQDTRYSRVYRILSANNLPWYIKRFQPSDIWSEGFLTYLKTSLPQHIR